MELNLMRLDFAQVGTTNRSCMRVIPSEKIDKSKKKRPLERVRNFTLHAQFPFKNDIKVVVGSQNGSVICVCRKNNDTQVGRHSFVIKLLVRISSFSARCGPIVSSPFLISCCSTSYGWSAVCHEKGHHPKSWRSICVHTLTGHLDNHTLPKMRHGAFILISITVFTIRYEGALPLNLDNLQNLAWIAYRISLFGWSNWNA